MPNPSESGHSVSDLFCGTYVPVEEPSTASEPEVAIEPGNLQTRYVRL